MKTHAQMSGRVILEVGKGKEWKRGKEKVERGSNGEVEMKKIQKEEQLVHLSVDCMVFSSESLECKGFLLFRFQIPVKRVTRADLHSGYERATGSGCWCWISHPPAPSSKQMGFPSRFQSPLERIDLN